jgi:hypothetical protein
MYSRLMYTAVACTTTSARSTFLRYLDSTRYKLRYALKFAHPCIRAAKGHDLMTADHGDPLVSLKCVACMEHL